MSVCCDRLWRMTNHRYGLLEKLLCGIPISFLAQPRINQLVRNWSASKGAKRLSQSQTVSCVKTKPPWAQEVRAQTEQETNEEERNMKRSLEAALERYPRISLTRLPTPLQALPSLSARLGLQVLIKRDDLTDLTLGGDKPRKLEYEVARAQAQGADTLVTCGSSQGRDAVCGHPESRSVSDPSRQSPHGLPDGRAGAFR